MWRVTLDYATLSSHPVPSFSWTDWILRDADNFSMAGTLCTSKKVARIMDKMDKLRKMKGATYIQLKREEMGKTRRTLLER